MAGALGFLGDQGAKAIDAYSTIGRQSRECFDFNSLHWHSPLLALQSPPAGAFMRVSVKPSR